MSTFDKHLATQQNDVDDDRDIAPPKTPDYRPNGDDFELTNQDMTVLREEYDEDRSPPPSQSRPV